MLITFYLFPPAPAGLLLLHFPSRLVRALFVFVNGFITIGVLALCVTRVTAPWSSNIYPRLALPFVTALEVASFLILFQAAAKRSDVFVETLLGGSLAGGGA